MTLKNKTRLRLDLIKNEIHIIGHSLGAQTAGAIGRDYVKRTKGNKIDSIVSLDAASPNFDSFKISMVHEKTNCKKREFLLRCLTGFTGRRTPFKCLK